MRRYETIIIVDPDLSEEERKPLVQRLEALIPQHGGFPVMVDEWGVRRLAYKVKKKPRGYYVRLDYCGNSDLVNEMERFLRIDDRALKYMTVLIEKDVDIESIKAEIARAAAEAEARTLEEKADGQPASPDQPPEQPPDEPVEQTVDETDAQVVGEVVDREEVFDGAAVVEAQGDATAGVPVEPELPETENKKEES